MKSVAKLSSLQIAIYGLPAIAISVLTLPFFIFIPTFYTETLGLNLAAVGIVLSIIRLFDALNDPVIGFLSDRVRPTYGRRRSWFLAGIPVTMLGTWMVFVPGDTPSILYLAFWGLFLSIGWSVVQLPYTAWGAELSGDYRTRSRLSAVREGLVVLGTLIAITLPLLLSESQEVEASGLVALAVFVCIVLPLSAALTVWKVPEPLEHSRQQLGFRDGLVFLRQNREFVRLLLAFFINGLANGLPATLFLLFVGNVLAASSAQGPLLFLYFLCGIVGVPIWLKLSDHWGKHRTWCIAMILALPVFLTVLLLGEGDLWWFGVICVLTGLTLGADLTLPASIQADVIDIDTAESGEQRSGFYFAFWGLATKAALALGVGIAFPVLSLAGFNAQSTNDGTAIWTLSILYGGLPVALKLLAIGLMWNFPLDEARQRDLRRKIESA
ncbi:MAG: MFS transporter [Hyphomicrobiales bacterium]